MGKILLVELPKRIFLTATDKRNRFSCLLPIFIEQLDTFKELKINERSIDLEIILTVRSMSRRLGKVFEKAAMMIAFDLNSDFTFQELIDCLRSYKSGPILIAGPEDLTYINFRLEKLIGLFD
ncbi:MAG: hypothetical protein ACD_7C00245G0001 [uncultured bacterium]|nr:MAG: hypothetical protein ACD_7C00245G0001 [uncultured bacterium]KKP68301.1 MAG: hypothetical protein UR66_C0006G0002 [Candidatus Moranbacteria bacterium GW2011_GWE1_35_17]KKP82589.1 MAG: hypothetical protein UR83_C0049G0002 [Candidatus Moranbacteria bacterium GW2011_GWF2_35_54]KKP84489.1 MAG: hypothetical protein UR82_C0004G0005 [Candidatus Moranbacteria bacterium GW2011_GWF1_35_5]